MFSTNASYGIVARVLHWGMALAIIAMFALGLWMRELDYYSPYYFIGPNIHKSVGIILFVLLLLRLVWRLIDKQPSHEGVSSLQKRLSHFVHWIFYPLLSGLMIAGYFISTADGRAISVFGLFDVPAVINKKGMEATAGLIHYYMAFLIIIIAALHAGVALYHHFIVKDGVLTSMLGSKRSNKIET
ncbi:MAG: cytochrome b [Hyphomicrobiales bacterium]